MNECFYFSSTKYIEIQLLSEKKFRILVEKGCPTALRVFAGHHGGGRDVLGFCGRQDKVRGVPPPFGMGGGKRKRMKEKGERECGGKEEILLFHVFFKASFISVEAAKTVGSFTFEVVFVPLIFIYSTLN